MKEWFQSPNQKVKSWLTDIADKRLITIVQALAVVYVKITGPYWRLVIHDDTKYLEMYKHIQPFYSKVKEWIENPEGLLDPDDFSLFRVVSDTKRKKKEETN